jgi:deoxycytidylate deaminase
MADGGEKNEEQKEDVLANKSAKDNKIATKYAISVFQEYCQSLHGHANAYLSGAGRFGHTTSSTIIVPNFPSVVPLSWYGPVEIDRSC